MPAERRFGMDHQHYDWSPLPGRAVWQWPQQARVAVCVVVTLEHTEWLPPEGSVQAPPRAAGMLPRPYPDYARLTHREYGHRVGIFRLLDVLAKHAIPPTVAMDALTAEHYPYLVEYCLQHDYEIIAHGQAASRLISSQMTEAAEMQYIQEAIATLTRATGRTPAGWLGPEYGESARTPQLLARAGIRYLCDWVNDEQPYPLHAPEGVLWALPIMLELDDVHALWQRRMPVQRYERLLTESFDGLYEDGAQTGRLLVLHLHPWLIGQPFRIKYLDNALGRFVRRQGVWAAQGSAIAEWCRTRPPVP